MAEMVGDRFGEPGVSVCHLRASHGDMFRASSEHWQGHAQDSAPNPEKRPTQC